MTTIPKFVDVIYTLFCIEGVFLIISGFVKGADLLAIVRVCINSNNPMSITEFYVLLGIFRILITISAINEVNDRALMIVVGILLVFFSICGMFICISSGYITDSNIYGIVIEFIVMFILSLLYLIYAFKQVEN